MKMFPRLVLGAAAWLAAVSGSFAADSAIYSALGGDLVSLQGSKVKKFETAPLAQTKYFAIYYSAEWCPPCRAFTPDLVKWYRQTKPANPQFELIFVSNDQSEEQMEKYITGDKMPWPALDFKKRTNRALTKYAGNGIPCLVLVDASGNVLSHSYEGQKYVGPRKVLRDVDKTLQDNPATDAEKAAASAAAAKPAGGGSNFDEIFKKKPAQ